MQKYNIEWIGLDEDFIAINPATGDWLLLDETGKEIVTDFEKGLTPAQILRNHPNITKKDIVFLVSKLNKYDFISTRNSGAAHACHDCHGGKFPKLGVLNLTEGCNLKCTYCYVGAGEGQTEYMKPETACKIVDEYLAMNGDDKSTIVMHGGEPFLNYSLIEALVEHCKPYRDRVELSIQTNATLITQERAEFLKANDVGVGISIDGPQKFHDETRPLQNGKGSFNQVLQGIKTLQSNGIRVGAITVLTAHNIEHVGEIVDFFIENDISTFSFAPMQKIGRGLNDNDSFLTGEQIFEAYKTITQKIIEYNSSDEYTDAIKERTLAQLAKSIFYNVHDYMCMRAPCGAGRDILGFGLHGDIYMCDDFINDDNFKIGNVHDGSIKEQLLKSTILKEKSKRKMEDIIRCKNCTWRSICGGICYSTDYYSGANGEIETEMCVFYKMIIPYLITLYEKEPDLPRLLDFELVDTNKKYYFEIDNRNDDMDTQSIEALLKVHKIGKMDEVHILWKNQENTESLNDIVKIVKKKGNITWYEVNEDMLLHSDSSIKDVISGKLFDNVNFLLRSTDAELMNAAMDKISEFIKLRNEKSTNTRIIIDAPLAIALHLQEKFVAFIKLLDVNDRILLNASDINSGMKEMLNDILSNVTRSKIDAKLGVVGIDVEALTPDNLLYYYSHSDEDAVLINGEHYMGFVLQELDEYLTNSQIAEDC